MNINVCAAFVHRVETWRAPLVISLIKYLIMLADEREEVQPYIDRLKTLHLDCVDQSVEFFNGKNAELRYQLNFEKWYALSLRFLDYLPELGAELKHKYKDLVPDEFINSMRIDAQRVFYNEIRN